MNDVHKIAVFWEDVYILYVSEMARDCMFLLLIDTLSNLGKRNITIYNLQSNEEE